MKRKKNNKFIQLLESHEIQIGLGVFFFLLFLWPFLTTKNLENNRFIVITPYLVFVLIIILNFILDIFGNNEDE